MNKGFSFGGIKVDSRKQVLKLKPIDSPVLSDKLAENGYKQKGPIAILTDEYYGTGPTLAIEKFLRKNGITQYIILSPIKYDITREEIEKDQKEGVISFYKKNKSDFMKYIPKGAPIITSGPAIYSLLQEDDIYPSHVQQRIFGVPNFWFSYNLTSDGNWVYPIEAFRDLFALGFEKGEVDSYRTRLAELQFNDIRTTKKLAPRYPKLIKHFINSKQEFIDSFYEPNKNRTKEDILSWDLETSGLSFIKDRVGCITLSFNGVEGWYVPWEYVDKEKLDEIFGKVTQLGANLKFDVKFMMKEGLKNATVDEDVYIMGHTLDETRSNSLKALAFYYSEFGGYERALDAYKSKYKIDNYLNIDEDILKEYAIMDAIVCRRIYDRMLNHLRLLDKKYPNEKLEKNSMEEYYRYRRIPANKMYIQLEYEGIYINKRKLDDLREVMKQAISDLREELSNDFGVSKDFNWSSSEKVGRLLEKKGWEELGRTVKGFYNVGKFQYDRWKKTHPEAAKLQQLSSYETLIDSFVGDVEGTKGWSQYLVHHDGDPEDIWRMHPDYISMGTDSGRTRCKNPNMQNVPTRGKFTKEIKACLCTPNDEEYYLCTVDYSALQLRLSGINSNDENLTRVFTTPGLDAHCMSAYNIFCNHKKFDVEIINVEDEKGNKYEFLGGQLVETRRGEIFASELREDDELIFL